VVFDYSFLVESVMTDFLTTLDMLAKIGGLWAAFKILIAIFGPLFILRFMLSLGMMIKRKAE